MTRLALRLARRSGREALVRLAVTAAAVMVGVAILLAVLAEFSAFQSTAAKPCWECTGGTALDGPAARPAAGAELWNYGDDIYAGRTVERLYVAALGPGAPVPPGVSALPRPGTYDASPALAALLRRVPRDQLGDRFGGRLAGTIGPRALSGPGELVVYIGARPAQLAARGQTVRVTGISARPAGQQVWTPYFRTAFAVAALAFLFPILILIGTATRLAAARLEQRYAALRLAGATSRQVAVIAAVEAVLTGLAGALAGTGVFAAFRPLLADSAVTSARYFPAQVTLSAADYAVVLIGVPAAAALAAVLSLRRVRISPLGVRRRVTPPPPGIWRIVPLAAGAVLFAVGAALTSTQKISPFALLGLLVIMAGLVTGGPWLTERAARLLRRSARGAAALLAARRLSDNPSAAFRSVRGLVLAVFLGTAVAGLLPAITALSATPASRKLDNVLLDQFIYAPTCGNTVNCTGGPDRLGPGSAASQRIGTAGLPPRTGAALLSRLRAIRGAAVFAVYSPPQTAAAPKPGGPGAPGGSGIMTCAGLRRLAALGQCAPGRAAVMVNSQSMYGDNPANTTDPIAGLASPAYAGDLARLPLQAVLVKVPGPAALERARTVLAASTPLSESGTAPRTFGEAVAARVAVGDTLSRLLDVAVAVTLLVAACSLAVAAGGSLVERRRPFALLRVSGTPVAALRRVVLLETALPLAVATVAAAGVAYGVAAVTVGKLAPPGSPLPAPGGAYYLLTGAGLAVSLAVIAATLPLLSRMTGPAAARFE